LKVGEGVKLAVREAESLHWTGTILFVDQGIPPRQIVTTQREAHGHWERPKSL